MAFLFGNIVLDVRRRELRSGSTLLAIEPQVFDILEFLIRNRDRVVSKDDLLAAVWGGRIVSDSAIAARINGARRVIGDNGEQQRWIRTIARKGFRFVGDVREEQGLGTLNSPSKVTAEDPPAAGRSEAMGSERAPSGIAERRLLTIMACNMVGITAISSRLDPEDLGKVTSAYHGCVREVVECHGGFVAKYMAEGVLAYFGYPQAHEDDAERAVRAGLAATRAVSELRVECFTERLEARIGVATGLVVIGNVVSTGAATEHGVVGETPLLASKLPSLAAPGEVVISAGTRRLLGSLFDCRELDGSRLKGSAEPTVVYRVLGESAIASRFEALRSSRAQLIGREEEIELLARRWEQAKRGEGRVVLVTGEPGIGKSRLIYSLQERLESGPIARIACFCSPNHKEAALHPISAHLLRAAGIASNDSAEIRLEKLESLLTSSSENLARDMALLASLLSIPGGERYPLPKLTPQQMKDGTLGALLRYIERASAAHPVLIVFEDLQWIDPTSLEVLCRIIEQASGLPVLLLMTARPEFKAPWPNDRHTSSMALTRLGRSEIESLVCAVTHGRSLPLIVVEQIVRRTDGVPLFVEELTKTVLESGVLRQTGDGYEMSGQLPNLAIPSTLHASLLARLDRLASAKDVAQIAAVIGREFSYRLILAVAGFAETDLNAALARLVAAELVFQRGEPPEAAYIFKHALVQDAAYASVLRARRRLIHAAIKGALEGGFPEVAEAQPELLAFHCGEAGLVCEAIDYWARAGRQAVQQSANREATGHIRRALELLKRVPEGIERDGRELNLLITLGPALMATRPSADPEVVSNYARAGDLARRTGRLAELFPSLWGAHLVAVVGGDPATADRIVEQLFAIARRVDDPGFLLQAHHAAFGVQRTAGDLAGAQKHAQAVLDLYDPDQHGRHALVYGAHDPGACARMNLALLLLLRGLPDQSQAQVEHGLALARSLQHPQTLLQTIRMAAELHCLRREHAATANLVAELLPLSLQHGSAVGRANATLLGGWTRIMQGEPVDGLRGVQEGLRLWRQTRSKLHVPQRLACIAEFFVAGDKPELAWPLLEEAFAAAQHFGERFFESELYRLKGALLLVLYDGRQDDATACLRRALATARMQDARLLELRAATSLARMWHQQDRHNEAATLLGPLLGRFTGDFALPDLQAAKALLDPFAA